MSFISPIMRQQRANGGGLISLPNSVQQSRQTAPSSGTAAGTVSGKKVTPERFYTLFQPTISPNLGFSSGFPQAATAAPSAEMVRIILSQYQRITLPEQFTLVAFEVLQLLIRSPWVLREGRKLPRRLPETPETPEAPETPETPESPESPEALEALEEGAYVVREDALATLTPELCQLMNREQNDDTFKQLVRMKGGQTSEETSEETSESGHKKRKRATSSHASVRFAG